MKRAPASTRRPLAGRGRKLARNQGAPLRSALYKLDCRLRNESDLLQRERLKATMAIIKNPQRRFAAEFIARQVRVMNGSDAPVDAEWLRAFHDQQKQRGSP